MPDVRVALAPPGFDDWASVHALLTDAFAGMDGRIDPPSSLRRMTPGTLAAMGASQVVALAHDAETLVGCGFGEPQGGDLYLSKLAVKASHTRRGVLRAMVNLLSSAAKERGLSRLTLKTRVELTENHATFAALGFEKVGETRHPGFDRTTSLSFARQL